MPIPLASTGSPSISHPIIIVFIGPTNLRSSLNPLGVFIGNHIDINGQNTHAFIIDPRYAATDVMNYIVELGGSVYVRPSELQG